MSPHSVPLPRPRYRRRSWLLPRSSAAATTFSKAASPRRSAPRHHRFTSGDFGKAPSYAVPAGSAGAVVGEDQERPQRRLRLTTPAFRDRGVHVLCRPPRLLLHHLLLHPGGLLPPRLLTRATTARLLPRATASFLSTAANPPGCRPCPRRIAPAFSSTTSVNTRASTAPRCGG